MNADVIHAAFGQLPPDDEAPPLSEIYGPEDHDDRADHERSYEAPVEPAEQPFRCLGHDRGRYYFLPQGGGQVVSLKARELHSAPELVALARLSWWEGAYPGRQGFNTRAAGNALIRQCEAVGIYDPDRLRGRGVWLDEGNTVLHLGDKLLCDGRHLSPSQAPGRHIYEAGRPLAAELGEPLDNRAASGLLKLCCEIAWEDRDRDGRLLAGWLVSALACGAMPWRPHLWIISEAGGGKTWVLDNVVKPVLAGLALHVQSKTTEAGLRGLLRLDARPVVFDEAESQNEQDRARLQQILDLARAASSEGGADIAKGTRDGGVQLYRIRSSFAFSSINLGLTQAADESRILTLGLAPDEDTTRRAEAFARLRTLLGEVITPGFAAGLLARTMSLIPTIRHNAEVFATAIASGGVSRRAGDTLGVVLAGAFSLTSSKKLDAAGAAEFLEARTWVKSTAKATEAEPEWQRALLRLVQAEVRMVNGNGRPEVTTIGELVAVCSGLDQGAITYADADQALKRRGIRVEGSTLYLANRSDTIAAAFVGTPWSDAWRATLARAPGARRDVAKRFTPSFQDRSVAVPVAAVLRESS